MRVSTASCSVRQRTAVVLRASRCRRAALGTGRAPAPRCRRRDDGRPPTVTSPRDAIVVAIYLGCCLGRRCRSSRSPWRPQRCQARCGEPRLPHLANDRRLDRHLSLAYLTLWWRSANAGSGGTRPAGRLCARVAVAIACPRSRITPLPWRSHVRDPSSTTTPRSPLRRAWCPIAPPQSPSPERRAVRDYGAA